MFPGQQGATWPSQLWPPRLGIKLLEGAPWKSAPKVDFGSDHKNRWCQPGFCTVSGKGQSGHISPATPVRALSTRVSQKRVIYRGRSKRVITGALSEAALSTVTVGANLGPSAPLRPPCGPIRGCGGPMGPHGAGGGPMGPMGAVWLWAHSSSRDAFAGFLL